MRGRQLDPIRRELLEELRAGPRCGEMSDDIAGSVGSFLYEAKYLMHSDHFALHAVDLIDADQSASAIGKPLQLHDDGNRRSDLATDAGIGRPIPAIATICSRRLSASRGELACIVDIDPSWPVFIACIISKASSPRHSPIMMRSGRMRSAFFTRSRWRISPFPSMLGGRVSSLPTCNC